MKSSDLLIIIPAYNEEGSIQSVVNNIIQNYSQYDYVIINDGSRDQTSEICHNNGYNIIDLPVNLGLAGAFQTGLLYAYQYGYEKAVQFDADGQHLPEYIAALEEEIDKGNKMVIGSRFVTEKRPNSFRMLGNNYGPEPDTVSYLLRNGVPISEVQVRMEERQAGESYLTFSRSIKYMIHMFVSILFIQNFRERGK